MYKYIYNFFFFNCYKIIAIRVYRVKWGLGEGGGEAKGEVITPGAIQ